MMQLDRLSAPFNIWWCIGVMSLSSASLCAQPLIVDWYDELDLPDLTFAYIDPNLGGAEVLWGGNDDLYCYYDEKSIYFGGFGQPNVFYSCYDGGGSFDDLVAAPYQLNGPRTWVWNRQSIATPGYFLISFGPTELYNIPLIYPPGSEYARCVLPDGQQLYIGGTSTDCSPQSDIVYRVEWPDIPWRTCLPHGAVSLELQMDTLLAIGFPTVTRLDAQSGAPMDSFDLFDGAANFYGKSCIRGDSLYWSCEILGATHVGKYILGVGPAWEQTLPFAGAPVELFQDDYGHLWTAVENSLIWMNTQTGAFDSISYGTRINGMDLSAGSLLISGTLPDMQGFALRATPTP
ncbi:MAG: hypothetical protein ABI432_11900 [Flavobacteriales bacterium]